MRQMRTSVLAGVLLAVAAVPVSAQTDPQVNSDLQAYMSTTTQQFSSLTNFSFGVYSDIHMVENSYYGLLRTQWASLLQNNCGRGDAFQVIAGDLGYGNSTDIQNVLSGLTANPGALPIAKGCSVPFPVIFGMGNHELDGVGKRPWVDALMPGAVNPAHWATLPVANPPSPPGDGNHIYYSFNVGPNTHFIVLDGDYQTVQGPDTRSWQSLGADQIAWFKQDVAANAGKIVFVFIHEPIDDMPFGSTNTPYYVNNDLGLLLDQLSRYPSQAYVFSGHLHGLVGAISWRGVTSVHVMNFGSGVYGVRVAVAGTTVTITQQTGAPLTNVNTLPMYAAQFVSGTTNVLPIAEENTPSGLTRGPAVTSVTAQNGVNPTFGQYMLKYGAISGYSQIFVSELATRIVPGMHLQYDMYLYGTVAGDNIGLQPGWETTDGSLPTAVYDTNGVRLSDHPDTGMQHLYYEDLPSLKGCATNKWCSRDVDLTSLAGSWVMQWYLAAATGSSAGGVYLDHIRLTWPASGTVNNPPSLSLTSPAANATATAPGTFTISANAADSDGTVASVAFYAGTSLLGTVTQAPYSMIWSNVTAGTYSLTAKATDNLGATTTSAPISVTVNPAPVNNPPTVSLTSPASGATATAPATFTVTANAADSDGSVVSVSFFAGTTQIGSATLAPYTMTWSGVPAGTYNLTARAQDNLGATTTSAVVTVTVSNPPNNPPSVTLTSPANNATATAPAAFTISANASDTDGTIASVAFYAGTTLLGTLTQAPYTMTWSNVAAGTYAFTAKATDNVGATTTSQPVTVTVTPPASGLPTPWLNQDIGTIGVAGSSSFSSGIFTVAGSGNDIWNGADAFQFVYQTLNGNGTITARVATVQNTDAWAKVGVMIRDNLGTGSVNVAQLVTPGNGLPFQWRSNAYNVSQYTPATGNAPVWVRLVRSGNTFTGYQSSDGSTWTQTGSATVTMGTTVYVGLAVTAHNNSVLNTATFSNVSVQ